MLQHDVAAAAVEGFFLLGRGHGFCVRRAIIKGVTLFIVGGRHMPLDDWLLGLAFSAAWCGGQGVSTWMV